MIVKVLKAISFRSIKVTPQYGIYFPITSIQCTITVDDRKSGKNKVFKKITSKVYKK